MARRKSAYVQGHQLGINDELDDEIRGEENASGLDAFLKEAKRKSEIVKLNVSLAEKLDDFQGKLDAIKAMAIAANELVKDATAIVKRLEA